jgi:hypothetical protein
MLLPIDDLLWRNGVPCADSRRCESESDGLARVCSEGRGGERRATSGTLVESAAPTAKQLKRV